MKLLVTGLTGKLGSHFLAAFEASERFAGWSLRAICHNRTIEHPRVEVVGGSLSDRGTVAAAMDGITHVLHMAAVKESPDLAMDVGVKGMFNLLEAFRGAPQPGQFILIGGDCSVGHMFQHYPGPVTEQSPRRAYPGCYALTKVLEEVMLEQYRIQYGLNTCCLRAPWIMEKDDFRYALSFSEQFGGPLWAELLPSPQIEWYARENLIPLLLDRNDKPLKRNFVHVSDVASAILAALDNPAAEGELFNISMNEPVDYGRVADYLQATRSLGTVEISTPYYSNWLDNSKARLRLDWEPEVGIEAMIDNAWDYTRAEDDPRIIWYPG